MTPDLDIDLEAIPTIDPSSELNHWVCSEGPGYVAYCGADVRGVRWLGDDETPNCAACDAIYDAMACPHCGGWS
jgi:hypothetical protein